MTNILSVLLAAFAVLSGPDGKLNITLESSPDRAVLYSVDYGGEPMLEPASLGLVAQDCDYGELTFTGMDQEEIKVDYRLDRAKTSHVSHDAIRYIAGAPARSAVIARLSGDVWYVGAINAAEENFAIDVNEIAATLGKENAAAIHTDGWRLVRKDGGFRKPLAVAVNDGAVLVLW